MELDPVASQAAPRSRRTRAVVAVAAALGIAVVAGVALAIWTGVGASHLPAWIPGVGPSTPAGTSVERIVPEGTRIKVEVLNASEARGAARTVAFLLRDSGFDVVYFGNTSERHDSTIVRDRTGHADWAALAQAVMEPAVIETRPDSTRLVDLTVLVGRLWRPPAESLRP